MALTYEDLSTTEIKQINLFDQYLFELKEKRIIIQSLEDPNKARIILPSDASRYTTKGRKRIKAKIYKRLGRWRQCPGVLMTLTFDPKKIERYDAWLYLGRIRRAFMNKLNQWRRRHGYTKLRSLSVIELQKQTGYPHIHIVFPNLRFVAPIAVLTELWGMANNSVDVLGSDNFSPTAYICKYISKMDGWTDYALAYLWTNKTRIYSMSRDYSLPDYAEKKVPEWFFRGSCTSEIYKTVKAYTYDYVENKVGSFHYSGIEQICQFYDNLHIPEDDFKLIGLN
jgi:hypothetical protein